MSGNGKQLKQFANALLLTLAAPLALAQPVYIWTDDQGIRHFSDRQPEADYAVEVVRALAEPRDVVRFVNIGSKTEPEWQLSNRLAGPVTVEVLLPESRNTISDPPLPARLELAPVGRRSILLGPLEPGLGWAYRIELRVVPGPVNAHHDADWPYRLPLAEGTAARIGQGFGGHFSHTEIHSRYAIDIPLPPGTPIHAARAGVVMDTERWFHRAGTDLKRDGPRANYVRILHSDGSMAVYAHLDYGGITVRDGQRVEVGQMIGRSGNTGYSTGPHLHFAVQVNQNMQLRSVPFRMQDHQGREMRLEAQAQVIQ
ncbi:MAG: hypothetical protein CVV18_02595 [Gammaproteobacteria bacterium HGW-Gammaproteobacteria-8]|nr:MAG: hypothetical protein CVV18_02595 [Gammaproteobacteria bacterium HGW-Gammaproteobacteria-8]